MCGIWAYIKKNGENIDNINIDKANKNSVRGPDKTVEIKNNKFHLCFYRLAINDLSEKGDQPFVFDLNGDTLYLMCNGEIYNYKNIIDKYNFIMSSSSDCEVIYHLLKHFNRDIEKVVAELRGEFAFIGIIESKNKDIEIVVARDKYGVRPLYYGITDSGIIFSSLMKGIVDENIIVYHFKPGHFYIGSVKDINLDKSRKPELYKKYKEVTDAFIDSVRIRLDGERPIGFLLSGGLDSSLVVAVSTKICGIKNPTTFSIGFDENSTDLKYANIVSKYLETNHHNVVITEEQGINSVESVVNALETYDTTTVRASIPQYLLAKYISENTNIKIILNGDGSDEVSMGYLYNYYSPSDEESVRDSYNLLHEIHMFDGLRVDRCLGSHGLEARLPFLDPKYVDTYLSLPIDLRRPNKERMEKQFLRDAFKHLYPDLLPYEVLYRRKEAFSDGVSTIKKSWFEVLQDAALERSFKSDKDWYYDIFTKSFPNQKHIIPHYWMPKWTDAQDPSARTLKIY